MKNTFMENRIFQLEIKKNNNNPSGTFFNATQMNAVYMNTD